MRPSSLRAGESGARMCPITQPCTSGSGTNTRATSTQGSSSPGAVNIQRPTLISVNCPLHQRRHRSCQSRCLQLGRQRLRLPLVCHRWHGWDGVLLLVAACFAGLATENSLTRLAVELRFGRINRLDISEVALCEPTCVQWIDLILKSLPPRAYLPLVRSQ
jgi:hypothetical protein